MNGSPMRLLGGVCAAIVLGLTGAAPASAAQEQNNCFYITQWQGGWSNPDPNTILIRVNLNDIYRIGLSSPVPPMLNVPGYHLLFKDMGDSGPICAPVDLNSLAVAGPGGFREPLFVSSLTKLSAAEAAALPVKDRP